MSMVIGDFEKLKTKYESSPDFRDINTKLKDGMTNELDSFVLQDWYLFLCRKLYMDQFD